MTYIPLVNSVKKKPLAVLLRSNHSLKRNTCDVICAKLKPTPVRTTLRVSVVKYLRFVFPETRCWLLLRRFGIEHKG